jgi:hypothetical protein
MALFPTRSPADTSSRSSVLEYLKHAFRYRWNLLLFLGGAALGAMSPWPDAILPLLGGLEIAYLTAMLSSDRFRTGIDAKLAAEARGASLREDPRASQAAQQSLQRLLDALPLPSMRRFMLLRQRCFEMRDIASGVRGHAAGTDPAPSDSISAPSLDRLLFLFLKLLVTQAGLDRFLKSTSEQELSLRLEDVKKKLTAAQASNDERVTNSLKDSVADAELRLDNYRKSKKDSDFVAVELDRIETKIQALIEMGVSRQDPDFLSTQVTAAAESMQHTEDTVNQLQHLTGLADQLEEPPAIMSANLDRVGGAVRDR